jgi:WD40 repeat protein
MKYLFSTRVRSYVGRWAAVLCLAVMVLASRISSRAEEPVETRVQRLVRLLGSEKFEEREKAAKEQGKENAKQQLPVGALTRLTTGNIRDGAGITSLAFSPDGKLLASGSTEARLRLWDLATGKIVFQVTGAGTGGVAFSPDGKLLASAQSEGKKGTIRVWEVATGKELCRFVLSPGPRRGEEQPLCLAFSPDGKFLACGCVDATARILEADSGKEVQQFYHPPFSVCSIAFSPDGKVLASGTHYLTIRLWDAGTGKLLADIKGHRGGAFSLAFSEDGRRLASASFDNTIRVWQVPTGAPLRVCQGHDDAVAAVAFSADGKMLFSGGRDNTVRLWEAETGKERRCVVGHGAQVMSLALSPDRKTFASGSYDTTIVLWDATIPMDKDYEGRRKFTDQQLQRLWADLAGDAPRAFEAMCVLRTVPGQAVPLLRERLPASLAVDQARLHQLVANLDSEFFETRENATKELEKLAFVVEPELRKTMTGAASPEVRSRLAQMLDRLNGTPPATHWRALRALELLEHIGTPDAARILKMIAETPLITRFTLESQAALRRLSRKLHVVP